MSIINSEIPNASPFFLNASNDYMIRMWPYVPFESLRRSHAYLKLCFTWGETMCIRLVNCKDAPGDSK